MSNPNGTVVQVYLRAEARTFADRPFELVETDFPDLEQFLIAAADDRLICGSVLVTSRNPEGGGRLVHRRRPIAFRGSAILRADLPTWRLIEAEEST